MASDEATPGRNGPSAANVARRALRTIRRHWRPLLIVAAVIFIPLAMIEVIDEHLGEVDFDNLSNERFLEVIALSFVIVTGGLLGEIFFAGVIAAAVSETHGGRAPSLGQIVRSLPYLTLIAIDILFSVGVALGLILIVVPGIVFFGYFAIAAPLAKIEHLGVRAAFRRSFRLVRGHLLLALGILAPVALGGEVLGELLTSGAHELFGEGLASEFVGALVGEAIATPLWAFAAVSLTYELIETEGSPAAA
jgi:hypothetical protein